MKILIATHGNYANGIKSSLQIILGENKSIACINAFIGNKSIKNLVDSYFENLSEDEPLLILTDLNGGSVNQYLMSKAFRTNTWIVTGINLALCLELCLYAEYESTLDNEKIIKIIDNARNEMRLVNEDLRNYKYEEDFK